MESRCSTESRESPIFVAEVRFWFVDLLTPFPLDCATKAVLERDGLAVAEFGTDSSGVGVQVLALAERCAE